MQSYGELFSCLMEEGNLKAPYAVADFNVVGHISKLMSAACSLRN